MDKELFPVHYKKADDILRKIVKAELKKDLPNIGDPYLVDEGIRFSGPELPLKDEVILISREHQKRTMSIDYAFWTFYSNILVEDDEIMIAMMLISLRMREACTVYEECLEEIEYKPKSKMCGNCYEVGIMLECSACRRAWYCSKECQVKKWKRHRSFCYGK